MTAVSSTNVCQYTLVCLTSYLHALGSEQALEQDLRIEKGQEGIVQVKLPTYIKVFLTNHVLSMRPCYFSYAFDQVLLSVWYLLCDAFYGAALNPTLHLGWIVPVCRGELSRYSTYSCDTSIALACSSVSSDLPICMRL